MEKNSFSVRPQMAGKANLRLSDSRPFCPPKAALALVSQAFSSSSMMTDLKRVLPRSALRMGYAVLAGA